MRVKITGNHSVDGAAPGDSLTVDADRARLLATQGHISWDELKPKKKTTKKKAGK